MCGIIGVINNYALVHVLNGLRYLQNRGYDSAGICIGTSSKGYSFTHDAPSADNNTFKIIKEVSDDKTNAIEKLSNKLDSFQLDNHPIIAFGHTRWATHGAKTISNAHPHHNNQKTIYIAHNGIIENYLDLKHNLMSFGYTFYSETDTEVLVNTISHYVHDKNLSLEVTLKTLNENNIIKGSWAVLIMIEGEKNRIYYMKNGSPLLIGKCDEGQCSMIASEMSAFSESIKSYASFPDGSYGYIECMEALDSVSGNTTNDPENNLLIRIENNFPLEFREIQYESKQLTPDPWDHWTIKEINDQVVVTKNIIENYVACNGEIIQDVLCANGNKIIIPSLEAEETKKRLLAIDHIILLGCGTSYHACKLAQSIFKSKNVARTYEVIDGADLMETDIPQIDPRRILFILLSQSGETKDLYRCLKIANTNDILTLAFINVKNSLIAREADLCVYFHAGRENAVASTKSFLNQCIALHLFSLWIEQNRTEANSEARIALRKEIYSLNEISGDVYNIIQSCNYKSKSISDNIYHSKANNLFILGKGPLEWIAKEGALKIKEISYLHAEGYSASSLKHGPFALLTRSVPVFVLAADDDVFDKIRSICEEIHSRHADIILITNKKIDRDTEIFKEILYVPTKKFNILSIIPLQMIAYYLALAHEYNPDFPRNLAKVVTVE
jgi:glucosamine--fructose-6-phosphate aminotransferase (isomerizing)